MTLLYATCDQWVMIAFLTIFRRIGLFLWSIFYGSRLKFASVLSICLGPADGTSPWPRFKLLFDSEPLSAVLSTASMSTAVSSADFKLRLCSFARFIGFLALFILFWSSDSTLIFPSSHARFLSRRHSDRESLFFIFAFLSSVLIIKFCFREVIFLIAQTLLLLLWKLVFWKVRS